MEDIVEYTLKKLDKHYATRTIRSQLATVDFDRKIAEQICVSAKEIAEKRGYTYDEAVQDFINFSLEFLELQIELEKKGAYKFDNFKEAQKNVYDNPEVMGRRYLNGVMISQAFWLNHYKVLAYFLKNFCFPDKKHGSVLEVPVGTGIFLSKFISLNPGWNGIGYDISKSSVEYAKEFMRINNKQPIEVVLQNVFDIPETRQYDRIMCGELVEHLENPIGLLKKLKALLKDDGKLFLTTAVWAANIDHIYLFKNMHEVRELLEPYFRIEQEYVLTVFPNKKPTDEKTPINCAFILMKK